MYELDESSAFSAIEATLTQLEKTLVRLVIEC